MTIHKGDQFLCIKDVIMETGEKNYTKGKTYISERFGCITNDLYEPDHKWSGVDNTEEFFERIPTNVQKQ